MKKEVFFVHIELVCVCAENTNENEFFGLIFEVKATIEEIPFTYNSIPSHGMLEWLVSMYHLARLPLPHLYR